MEEVKTMQTEQDEEKHMENMITADQFAEIVRDNYPAITTYDWFGHKLEIRRAISYDEMNAFVNAVVNACFDADTGEYDPQNKDLMMSYGEIMFYTNVDLPKDTETAYDLIYATDLVDVIEKKVDFRQLMDIRQAVTEKIDYRLEQNMDALQAEMRKFEDVFKALGELMSTIDPEEIKRTVAAIVEHGGIDEGKLVKALYAEKAGDSGGEG